MNSVRSKYQLQLEARGYGSDSAQLAAIEELDRCANEWVVYQKKQSNFFTRAIRRPALPRGVYMFGGVGRGKSFLMDCFYQAVPVAQKTRLHFHEFMREVHRELRQLQGTVDPLDALGRQIAQKYKLICFDEFHVADVTDAMILHRLLDSLFAHGVGMVTTSNFQPDGLYPDGLHRDRILPAIELLKQQMAVINVDAGTDYRRRSLSQIDAYLHPLSDANELKLAQAFDSLAEGDDESPELNIESRTLLAKRRAGGVVWFDFKSLCGGARSQNDYLEIASRFHTVLLSGVRQMEVRHASEARRFTWLVDVLYDRHVRLILSAAVEAEALYLKGPLAHEFPRTVSRLQEMQTSEYLLEGPRIVDTRLT